MAQTNLEPPERSRTATPAARRTQTEGNSLSEEQKKLWEKWYPRDWAGETNMAKASLAARGLWCEALNLMMLDGTYSIEGSRADLARLLRCGLRDLNEALPNLRDSRVCEIVFQPNGYVTLISRRRQREYIKRENGRLRTDRFRQKHSCNAPVTISGSGSSGSEGGSGGKPIGLAQTCLDISDAANKLQSLAEQGFVDPFGHEVPLSLRTKEFMAAFADWYEYKFQRKEPYTEIGAKNFLQHKLPSLGAVDFVIVCIRESMSNQWAGVYAPRNQTNGGQPIWRQIEAKEDQINRHPANPEFVGHNPKATPEQKEQLKVLREELRVLKSSK